MNKTFLSIPKLRIIRQKIALSLLEKRILIQLLQSPDFSASSILKLSSLLYPDIDFTKINQKYNDNYIFIVRAIKNLKKKNLLFILKYQTVYHHRYGRFNKLITLNINYLKILFLEITFKQSHKNILRAMKKYHKIKESI